MDLGQPIRSIIPTTNGPVLGALSRTTGAMTAAEITRVLGGAASSRAVQYSLADLAADGLVIREQMGRFSSYRLNRSHLAAPALVLLGDLRRRLIRRVERRLAAWATPPERALLFGSFARGDADERSDIDLLLVRPADTDPDDETWRDQVTDLTERVHAWTGNDLGLVEYGAQELTPARWLREPLLAAVARDGVPLVGGPVRGQRVARGRAVISG